MGVTFEGSADLQARVAEAINAWVSHDVADFEGKRALWFAYERALDAAVAEQLARGAVN
jgi:hypothetical protein